MQRRRAPRRPQGMTTISPLRAAVGAVVATLAVGALGLGAGYALSGHGDGTTRVSTLPAVLAASTAGGTAPSSGISVSGTGTVTGTPDTLRLSMSVSTTAATVSAALDSANGAAGAVQAALRQHGVADKDVQTSNLSIQAQYGGGTKPVITGYQVSESLTATLHDLKGSGATITAAASAGGNATRIDGVSLDLTDTGALITAARTKAFQAAKDKAGQYAKAAGVSLGSVVSISETVNTGGPVPVYGAMDAAPAAKSVPISAGSQDVGVTVTVVFGLG